MSQDDTSPDQRQKTNPSNTLVDSVWISEYFQGMRIGLAHAATTDRSWLL